MLKKTGVVPFLLAPTLGLIVLPFITIALLINEIVRVFIAQILFLFYRNKIKLVSEGADGFWGYKKKGSSRNVVTYVLTPVDSLDVDKIAKFYMENIQYHKDKSGKRPYEKFEKIMTTCLGYFCWKSVDNFNIFNHVRVSNDNKVIKVKDLQEILTEFSKDMDESKPQWEIVVIPKYDDGSGVIKSILLCRFLHAYMDGLSFVMLFKEHITPDMEYTIDPLKFKIPLWKKFIFYINTIIYGPFFLTTLNAERFFLKSWISLKNKNDSHKKVYAWAKSRPISDETVRKIRAYSGIKASVTNVLSTAFVNAAMNVFPSKRLVDEILVSELVAYLPYPDPNPQNRYAYFTFGIPAKEEDVWLKLKRCKKDSLKSMLGPEVLSTFYFFKLAGRFPAFLFPIFLYGSSCSLLLSNAPFSKRKVCFRDGTPILEMAGFTPQPNDMGLSITSTRYGNEVKIFACADSSWMSQEELTKLIDQIPLEIEKMSKAIDAAKNPYQNGKDGRDYKRANEPNSPVIRTRKRKPESMNRERDRLSNDEESDDENDTEFDEDKRISITDVEPDILQFIRSR